jgi:hypothetical protein
MGNINMKFIIVTVLALPVMSATHILQSQSVAFAQSTLPAFSYEEPYQFPEKYEVYKRKKEFSATVYDKELYVGKFGNDGYFAVTRDDGAYDFSRPDPRGPTGGTRFRLKVPF